MDEKCSELLIKIQQGHETYIYRVTDCLVIFVDNIIQYTGYVLAIPRFLCPNVNIFFKGLYEFLWTYGCTVIEWVHLRIRFVRFTEHLMKRISASFAPLRSRLPLVVWAEMLNEMYIYAEKKSGNCFGSEV